MNVSQSRTRFHEWLVAGVFCVFFFFYKLAGFGLVGADEPRFAQIGREMLARHDWVSPTLYGRVWLEKPVLYYWSAMLSYRIFGVSDWSARFPVAVFSTLMVAAIYLFMRRFRPGTELPAVFITCSSAAIVSFARSGSTDMPLAACFTIALLGWLAWFQTSEKKWLLVFYFFTAAGMLAKGPVAPLLAGLIIVCFALLRRDLRLVLRTLWIPGIVLFLLTAMPWYVLVQLRNPQFFTEFILRQNLARFGTNLYHHEQPFWYYIPVLLLGAFPWTLFVLAALVQVARTWRRADADGRPAPDDLQKFLAIWAILPILFFSFSQSKLPGYILPTMPAWLLLTVLYFARMAAAGTRSRALWIAHALGIGVFIVLVFFAPAIVLDPHEMPASHLFLPSVVAAALAAMIAALVFWRGWQMLLAGTLCVAVVAAGLLLRTTAPVIDAVQSARPAATYLGNTTEPVVVFHVERGIQYGLGFYFNRETPSYDAGNFQQQDHFLITKKNDLAELIPFIKQHKLVGTNNRNCSLESVLRPDHAFQSPAFDLYYVSAECAPEPAAGGLSLGKK
jgi:4-amino-4-deoxy-L-arabinose transferase-like glycosyltransferase